MKTKRFVSLFLAICLLAALCCIPVFATPTSGSCGESITWSFDAGTGTLTFSGTGKLTISDDAKQSLLQIRDNVYHIVIEEGITAIGSSAFLAYNLKSLQVANSVKVIEADAFVMCMSLTDLDLGMGVTTIDKRAFTSCFSLKNVVFPASLQTLNSESFSDTALESIALPEGFTTLNNGTFHSTGLVKIYLPASMTTINYGVFRGCSALTDVYFGGTQAQWEAIDIDTSNDDPHRGNNEYLLAANIHYEHSHSFDSGTVTRQASCTQKGIKTYTCTVCGGAKQEAFSGSHKWDNGKVTAASCTVSGKTVYTCTVCNNTKEEPITATGHKWDSGTTNADTTVTYTCTTCSATKTEGTAVTVPPETTPPTENTTPAETTPPTETTAPTVGDDTPDSPAINTTPVETVPPTAGTDAPTDDTAPQKDFPWAMVIAITGVVLAAGITGAVLLLKKKK